VDFIRVRIVHPYIERQNCIRVIKQSPIGILRNCSIRYAMERRVCNFVTAFWIRAIVSSVVRGLMSWRMHVEWHIDVTIA